MDQIDDLMYNV